MRYGSGDNAKGTMDLRDGTANIFASDIELGRESNTRNSGTPSGVLWLGDILGNRDKEGQAQGNLVLSQAAGATNSITANLVRVGDSPNRGNSSAMNTLQLGPATNTMNTDTLILGGQKSQGTMTIAPAGTLTLEGRTPGTAVNVDLGFNVSGSTGNHALGILDMTGATLNATIDRMRLGRHGSGSGSGTGTFTLEDGAVTANSIILGTGAGNSTGTVNLLGGTSAAGSVTQGAATATADFNFTDGTLKLGTFGSDTLSMDLTQDGGILAPDRLTPGDSIGIATIWGDYIQNGGELELEIEDFGPAGVAHDQLIINGTSADGDLTIDFLGYTPALGSYFNLIEVTDGLVIDDWNILGDLPDNVNWSISLVNNDTVLRLSTVPEPSSLILATLGLIALGVLRVRRRR